MIICAEVIIRSINKYIKEKKISAPRSYRLYVSILTYSYIKEWRMFVNHPFRK